MPVRLKAMHRLTVTRHEAVSYRLARRTKCREEFDNPVVRVKLPTILTKGIVRAAIKSPLYPDLQEV